MSIVTNISSKQFAGSRESFSTQGERIIQVTGVFWNKGQKPCVILENKKDELVAGYHLKNGDVIKTNDARVEIRGRHGELIRLGKNAEIAFEETERGIEPVFYGEVFCGQTTFDPAHMGGKYRTSCWTGAVNYYVVPAEENTDVFYCLSEDGVIWEYDEMGRKFTIAHMDEGQKCVLEYFPNQPMRNRYHVKSIQQISNDEYDYIVNNFVNPKCWRMD